MCWPFFKVFKGKKVVVDIGAHIGVFSLIAAHNGATSIYSYEPLNENFLMIKDNIYINKFNRKMHAFNMAVSGRAGKVRLNLFGSPAGASLTNKPFKEKEGHIMVEAVTLRGIMDYHVFKKIDLLKIDAEGAEFDMLIKTPRKYFESIGTIFVECANWVDAKRPQKIRSFLERMGYAITDEYVDRRDTLIIAER
jgi:FkbM family methyltransferase